MTPTVLHQLVHQCPIPRAAEACELNGLAFPSVRATAMPRYNPLPGPTAPVSGHRAARPEWLQLLCRLAVGSPARCHNPLTRLSCLHASQVGHIHIRPQASPFQDVVLGVLSPNLFSLDPPGSGRTPAAAATTPNSPDPGHGTPSYGYISCLHRVRRQVG